MSTNKINSLSDRLEMTTEEMGKDIVKLGKFVFEKLSPKKIKEKKEHLQKVSEIIKTLSEEQINLFIELIRYTENFGGIDFNVPHTIEKERPEEKEKLLKIFEGMALGKTPTNFIKKELESQKKINNIQKENENKKSTKNQEIEDLKSNL